MRLQLCSNRDPFASLSFLANCEDTCSLSCVLESNASRCFLFYVEMQTNLFRLIQLTARSTVVDFSVLGMMQAYRDVMSLPLQT